MPHTYLDVDSIAEVTRELQKAGENWYKLGVCHYHDARKSYFNVYFTEESLAKFIPDGEKGVPVGTVVHLEGSAQLRAWTNESGGLQTSLGVWPKAFKVVEL